MNRTIPTESVKVDFMRVNYFYIKSKNDYGVYIIDPDAPAIHITIYNGDESGIRQHVVGYLTSYQEA